MNDIIIIAMTALSGISFLAFMISFFFVMFIGFLFGIGLWLAKKVVIGSEVMKNEDFVSVLKKYEAIKAKNKSNPPKKETKEEEAKRYFV